MKFSNRNRGIATIWATIAIAFGFAAIAGASAWLWQSSTVQKQAIELVTVQAKLDTITKDADEIREKNSALTYQLATTTAELATTTAQLQGTRETIDTLTKSMQDLENQLSTAKKPIVQPVQPYGPEGDVTKIAAVTKDDHIRGTMSAQVTMIEYSDFECPFCLRFHETLQQILNDYKGKVRLVYRQFPLRSIHPHAQKAAEASECASLQGKFWEMHDALFALNKAQNLNDEAMKTAAKEIGLNTSVFNDCLDTDATVKLVENDYQDGIAGGVQGTPGTFVNGQYLAGSLPYTDVKSIIDGLLK